MRYSELNLEKLNLDERKELILNYGGERVIIKTTHEPWLQRGKILGESDDRKDAYLFKSEDVTKEFETGDVINGRKRLINYLDTERILVETGRARYEDIRKCSRRN